MFFVVKKRSGTDQRGVSTDKKGVKYKSKVVRFRQGFMLKIEDARKYQTWKSVPPFLAVLIRRVVSVHDLY